MSFFEQRISDHPLLGRLPALFEILDSAAEGASADELGQIQRIRHVLHTTEAAVRAQDPELVAISVLNELDAHAQGIQTHLTNFVGNREANRPSLTAAQDPADAMARTALAGLGLPAEPELEAAREQAKSYRSAAGQYLRGIREELDGVRTELSQTQSRMSEAEASAAAAFQTLKQEIDERAAVIEQQKGRLDAAIQEYQAQFSQAQETRRAEHTAALEQVKEDADELLRGVQATAAAQQEQATKDAQNILESLKETKRKVEKLASATGGASQAGHYKSYADKEEEAADTWRFIAIVAAAVVGAGAIAAFFQQGADVSWGAFWAKAALTAPFAAIAAYAGGEAGRHRRKSDRARSMQNDILALDPYLIHMEKETADAIKSVVALRTFGQLSREEASHKDSDSPTGADLTAKMIEAVLDIIKRRTPKGLSE